MFVEFANVNTHKMPKMLAENVLSGSYDDRQRRVCLFTVKSQFQELLLALNRWDLVKTIQVQPKTTTFGVLCSFSPQFDELWCL
jgi:hypothetical protein